MCRETLDFYSAVFNLARIYCLHSRSRQRVYCCRGPPSEWSVNTERWQATAFPREKDEGREESYCDCNISSEIRSPLEAAGLLKDFGGILSWPATTNHLGSPCQVEWKSGIWRRNICSVTAISENPPDVHTETNGCCDSQQPFG